MTFKEAHVEFSARYYLWALGEFRIEIESGFPLLKRLDTQASKTCVRLMRQLSPSDQRLFADALVKRFHLQGVAAFGHNLSSGEMSVIQDYINSLLTTSTEEGTLLSGATAGDQGSKLNRKVFANILKNCLSPLLGNTFEKRGDGEWRYVWRVGDFKVHTYIDIGGRFHQLSYHHNIVFSGFDMLVDHASVHSWFGLSSQTHWRVDDSKVEATAHLLTELCDRFLRVAPKLLKGISP